MWYESEQQSSLKLAWEYRGYNRYRKFEDNSLVFEFHPPVDWKRCYLFFVLTFYVWWNIRYGNATCSIRYSFYKYSVQLNKIEEKPCTTLSHYHIIYKPLLTSWARAGLPVVWIGYILGSGNGESVLACSKRFRKSLQSGKFMYHKILSIIFVIIRNNRVLVTVICLQALQNPNLWPSVGKKLRDHRGNSMLKHAKYPSLWWDIGTQRHKSLF